MSRKVVIVGVGALGSHLVLFGRNWPADLDVVLWVVDDDRIETKNMASQVHTRMGMGRNKAQSLDRALQGMFGARVGSIPHRLTEDNVAHLLANTSLVIDCVDNGATRRLIQDFVREWDIPCLHGGLNADGTYGRVVWDEGFVVDDEDEEGQATCEGGEALPFHGLMGAQLAIAAQEFLITGKKRSYSLTPRGVTQI